MPRPPCRSPQRLPCPEPPTLLLDLVDVCTRPTPLATTPLVEAVVRRGTASCGGSTLLVRAQVTDLSAAHVALDPRRRNSTAHMGIAALGRHDVLRVEERWAHNSVVHLECDSRISRYRTRARTFRFRKPHARRKPDSCTCTSPRPDSGGKIWARFLSFLLVLRNRLCLAASVEQHRTPVRSCPGPFVYNGAST